MTAATATTDRVRLVTVADREATEDDVLVEGIVRRDQAALAEAYHLHSKAVYSAAYGVLRRRSLAEDVTQEIFVRLWNRPERFDPSRGSLRSFVRIDARGRAIDLLRSERARREREDKDARLEPSATAGGVEEVAMSHVTSERIMHFLQSLRPEERAPIALAYFDGHSYRKVAELLGLPEGTVKSRIRSGLANLKGLLAGAGIEPA